MARSFSILSGPDGPTAVFFAGKLGKDSLFFAGVVILAAAVAAAAVLLKKKK